MATKYVIATLTDEDLEEWTRVYSKYRAVQINPHKSTVEETESAVFRYYSLGAELVERYDVDTTEKWEIDMFGGKILVE